MFLSKLKTVALIALLLGTMCLGVRAAPPAVSAQQPTKPMVTLEREENRAEDKKLQPEVKPAGSGTLLLTGVGELIVITPDGKQREKLTPPKDTSNPGDPRLSPNGIRTSFVVFSGKPRNLGDNLEDPWQWQVVIQKLGADKPSRTIDFTCHDLSTCWSTDGKKLAVSTKTAREPDVAFENVLLDPETGKTEALALPVSMRVIEWSRDGKKFLVQEYDLNEKKSRLGLTSAGEKEVTPLCDLHLHPWWRVAVGRLSPDGKQLLFTDADPEDKDAHKWGQSNKPYMLDIASRKRELLADFPANAEAMGIAWSPTGKKVAFTWKQLHPELLKKDQLVLEDLTLETEGFLIIADPDGKNSKTVCSGKSKTNFIFGTIDWR
jgi:hypothetical protein